MANLRERLIGSIQRDRLADFLKRSDEQVSGCFYTALITSFNHLHRRSIPREFEDAIYRFRSYTTTVFFRDYYRFILLNEPLLKMKVSKVFAHNFGHSKTEIYNQLELDTRVPVEISDEPFHLSYDSDSTAIQTLFHPEAGRWHAVAHHPNPYFESTQLPIEYMGGIEELEYYQDIGFKFFNAFILERSGD